MLKCLIEYKDKNHRYRLLKLISNILGEGNYHRNYLKYKNIDFKTGIDLAI